MWVQVLERFVIIAHNNDTCNNDNNNTANNNNTLLSDYKPAPVHSHLYVFYLLWLSV